MRASTPVCALLSMADRRYRPPDSADLPSGKDRCSLMEVKSPRRILKRSCTTKVLKAILLRAVPSERFRGRSRPGRDVQHQLVSVKMSRAHRRRIRSSSVTRGFATNAFARVVNDSRTTPLCASFDALRIHTTEYPLGRLYFGVPHEEVRARILGVSLPCWR